jgi:hypothetical protein
LRHWAHLSRCWWNLSSNDVIFLLCRRMTRRLIDHERGAVSFGSEASCEIEPPVEERRANSSFHIWDNTLPNIGMKIMKPVMIASVSSGVCTLRVRPYTHEDKPNTEKISIVLKNICNHPFLLSEALADWRRSRRVIDETPERSEGVSSTGRDVRRWGGPCHR